MNNARRNNKRIVWVHVTNQYVKILKCLILFVLFICIKNNSIAQNKINREIFVDSVNLSIKWDSSEIKLEKAIADNKIWLDVLSSDSIFIKYFKNAFNNKPCFVYVASIEKKSDFQFEFFMYCRPMNVNPSELKSYGYAYYDVLIFKQNTSRFKIVSIKFTRIAIWRRTYKF